MSTPPHASSGAAATYSGTLLIVMMIWGLNLPVLKWLTGHFDPVFLSALRMGAGAALLAVLVSRASSSESPKPGQIAQLALASLLSVYLYQLAVTAGIYRTTATNGALVSALHPVVATMAALLLLREKPQGRTLAGALIALGGVALVTVSPEDRVGQVSSGDLLILASLFLNCAGMAVAQRVLTKVDAMSVALWTQAFGAVMLFAHAGALSHHSGAGPRMPSTAGPWIVLVLSGALSSGLSALLWHRAVAAVGMSKASMWMYWVPIFALVAALLVLSEPLHARHIAGLCLVLLGTRFATRA